MPATSPRRLGKWKVPISGAPVVAQGAEIQFVEDAVVEARPVGASHALHADGLRVVLVGLAVPMPWRLEEDLNLEILQTACEVVAVDGFDRVQPQDDECHRSSVLCVGTRRGWIRTRSFWPVPGRRHRGVPSPPGRPPSRGRAAWTVLVDAGLIAITDVVYVPD
jgi:hypothetical protein